MSFEGYYQVLCEKGHSNELPYTYGEGPCPSDTKCEDCGAEIVWVNLVDDTNCDNAGFVKLVEKTPEVACTCKCGNKHCSQEATYHIPEPLPKTSRRRMYWQKMS